MKQELDLATELLFSSFVYSPIVNLSPPAVMSMWASGLAAGTATVAWWQIVGPGYLWLAGGVTFLFGVVAALGSGSAFAWIGCSLTVLVVSRVRTPRQVAGAGVGAAIAFGVAAADTGVLTAVSGAVFLGGVSTEMMLGHWYLVDPRLPRWALRRLAQVAVVGVIIDFGVLVGLGVFPWSGSDTAAGLGFLLLTITTLILMAAVLGALGEEGYPGVMSATGLSYLALLTAVGAAVIGRLLVDGSVLS